VIGLFRYPGRRSNSTLLSNWVVKSSPGRWSRVQRIKEAVRSGKATGRELLTRRQECRIVSVPLAQRSPKRCRDCSMRSPGARFPMDPATSKTQYAVHKTAIDRRIHKSSDHGHFHHGSRDSRPMDRDCRRRLEPARGRDLVSHLCCRYRRHRSRHFRVRHGRCSRHYRACSSVNAATVT